MREKRADYPTTSKNERFYYTIETKCANFHQKTHRVKLSNCDPLCCSFHEIDKYTFTEKGLLNYYIFRSFRGLPSNEQVIFKDIAKNLGNVKRL